MDHHSHWGSMAELRKAFADFVEKADRAVLPESFGLTAPGPPLQLAVPGDHNRLNARAALAAIELAGLDVDAAAEALVSFPGVRRRLELKGSRGGVHIYDDYAHHPTEVRAALSALRELQPEHLIAVFQPHLYMQNVSCRHFSRSLESNGSWSHDLLPVQKGHIDSPFIL
jgi:UDP-N-acetylmuramate--alanine ligase